MQETQRWRCLWWVCIAGSMAVAVKVLAEASTEKDLGQCTVPNLSQDSIFYPLPTNLKVKPKSDLWELYLILSVNQAVPVPTVCIHLETGDNNVILSMFNGDCEGDIVCMGYLPSDLTPQNWSTLKFSVTSDSVLLQGPEGEPVRLTRPCFTLPQDGLMITVKETQHVETSVECADCCPVHYQASGDLSQRKRVGEWTQKSLYLHFRPGPSFRSLDYEVNNTMKELKLCERDAELRQGEKDVPTKWHRLDFKERHSNAIVDLNGEELEAIQLQESCTSCNHTLWMIGDGSFSFCCTPSTAEQTRGETEGPADVPCDINLLIVLPLAVVVLLCVVLVAVFFLYKKRRQL